MSILILLVLAIFVVPKIRAIFFAFLNFWTIVCFLGLVAFAVGFLG